MFSLSELGRMMMLFTSVRKNIGDCFGASLKHPRGNLKQAVGGMSLQLRRKSWSPAFKVLGIDGVYSPKVG